MQHSAPLTLHEGPFEGPAQFTQMIRDAIACAARRGWSDMVWSDANFADWPLCERSVVESLQAWSQKGRRLVLLAHSFELMPAKHPRFVTWRRQWGHIIECYVSKSWDATDFPSALWTPEWHLQRVDVPHFRGVASVDARHGLHLKEALNEVRRQGTSGFPATILGL